VAVKLSVIVKLHNASWRRHIFSSDTYERILGQYLLRQGGERVRPFAEVNRTRCKQDPSANRDIDHDRDAEARIARNTAVNWAASAMPGETRITAPASLTSISGTTDAAR
jgi:hypothetical protein